MYPFSPRPRVRSDVQNEPPTRNKRQEGAGKMTIQTSRESSVCTRKTKALAAGLLAAAMMAAGAMAANPAHASTTFTVNQTGDAPDAFTTSNTCDTDVFTAGDQCTLRAAIGQANATPGADTINSAIPGTGVKTIAVGATGLGTLPR